MTCENCEECRRKGYNFCKYCGEPIKREKKTLMVFAGITTAICAFILLFELITAWVKLPYLMENASTSEVWLYYLAPLPEKLISVSGTGLQILYIVELLIVTVSIGCCAYGLIKSIRNRMNSENSFFDNALTEDACFNGLLFAFQVAMLIVCTLIGINMDVSDLGTVADQMFSLMNASVYEEFLCRIVALGLPIMIVSLILKEKRTPAWKYLLEGFEYKHWMLIFVIFSASLFAVGHLGGWGTWKVIPTFIFGAFAGYMFIKYGVYATITFHFLTDFMLSETWLLGNGGLVTLSVLAMSFFSLPTVVIYLKKVRSFVKGITETEAE